MTTLAGRLGQSRVPWMLVGVLAATLAGALGGLLGPLPFVAVAGAVALVVAMVRAPGLVLGAYLLIPYYKGAVQPYSPVDLTLLLAAVNAAQFIPVVFAKRRPTGFGLQLTLWLALGAVVLGGVLYAPDPSMAFAKAVSYWVLVVLPLVPASLRVAAEPRQLALVAIAFFVMGVVTSVLGLSLLSPDSRLAILGMNTIQVARAALFLPIVGVLYIIPLRRRWLTVLTVALIPASLVVAVASGSRGPLLVLALIGGYRAVRALAAMRVGRWRLIGTGAGVVLLATVALVLLGPSLPVASLSRFGDLLAYVQGSGAGVETSAAVRVVLFGLAVQLWASSPLIGVGTAGFQVLSARALGAAGDAYPHNAILQVLSEDGIVGLVVFASVAIVGLVRRLPVGSVPLTIRTLYAFFLFNAMVSGDIYTDRETLGLLLLVLVVPLAADFTRAPFSAREPEAAAGRTAAGGALDSPAIRAGDR